jgi:cell division transport system ATP-binding protein
MALRRTRATRRDRAVQDEAPLAAPGRRAPARAGGISPPIVELREATVVYPGGHVGVERVSFVLGRGEFAFVVGPTGCGKSTLIKMLIREVEPASGEVRVAGRDIHRLPARRLPHLRRRIGTVFQDFKLLPNRTVYDNVAYALQVTGGNRGEIRSKVPEILRLVGLQGKIHNYPDQLSGGEQQRVSIARAFVNHPPLLLADEPTGNLDPETSIGIMQLLYRINRTGTTVLVATHDREMVDRMRRRVMALDQGRLVRDEAAAGYANESTSEFAVRVRAEMGVGEGHTNGEPGEPFAGETGGPYRPMTGR